jgi:thymidine kinase
MFSSKTSRLVEIYKQCQFCNISVVVINHNIDNRYDDELLITHDKVKIPCVKTSKLSDVWTTNILFENNKNVSRIKDKFNIRNCEVILINEGQFFEDLLEVVIDMLQKGKKIYVCGLDGDFERKKFGTILDLIPLCDKVHKLSSLCSICKDGTYGIFSMRLTEEKEQTVIGSDNYIPVCRKCYNKHSIILSDIYI